LIDSKAKTNAMGRRLIATDLSFDDREGVFAGKRLDWRLRKISHRVVAIANPWTSTR
jgi:hypothetical protein